MRIYEDIKKYETYPNYIRTNEFYDVFFHKYVLDRSDLGVPKIFKNLSFFNLKRFVSCFENIPLHDKKHSGKIDYNK